MRKVLVIGSGGSGKSTFARRLGEQLHLEVLHLDRFYWHAGWIETPKEEWATTVEQLLARDAWIMDGNYSGTLEARLESCDTVIFLDLNRVLCLWRVLKRAVIYRREHRPDMAAGCPENLSLEFIRWVWNYPTRTRPRVIRMLKAQADGKTIVRLRSRSEVKRFLARAVAASTRSNPVGV